MRTRFGRMAVRMSVLHEEGRRILERTNLTSASMSARNLECLVGDVTEVLAGLGIAHVLCPNGRLLGIRRTTPGVSFDDLRVGDQVECDVEQPYSRVRHARILERNEIVTKE